MCAYVRACVCVCVCKIILLSSSSIVLICVTKSRTGNDDFRAQGTPVVQLHGISIVGRTPMFRCV